MRSRREYLISAVFAVSIAIGCGGDDPSTDGDAGGKDGSVVDRGEIPSTDGGGTPDEAPRPDAPIGLLDASEAPEPTRDGGLDAAAVADAIDSSSTPLVDAPVSNDRPSPPLDAGVVRDSPPSDATVVSDMAGPEPDMGAMPDDVGAASADAPGGCNMLLNTAPTVAEVRLAQPPPATQGGTILDGTYFLTAWTTYTGVGGSTSTSGKTWKETLRIQGSLAEAVTIDERGSPEQHNNYTVTVNGNSITYKITCSTSGMSGARTGAYTATGNELHFWLYQPDEIFSYTRQP